MVTDVMMKRWILSGCQVQGIALCQVAGVFPFQIYPSLTPKELLFLLAFYVILITLVFY